MDAANPDGRGGPHVLVDDVDDPVAEPADRHHLDRVLRLRPGDRLTVGDGGGRWRDCRYGEPLEPVGDVVRVPEPMPALTVGLALVKGSRPELAVQKLTEIGVDRIVLFAAERSVVRWDPAKAAAQHERLSRVIREATMQCRRAWMPGLDVLVPLTELAAMAGVARGDFDGAPVSAAVTTILIGPEGGWTDAERALVPAAVRLGPHVQRSETAAISAGVHLAHMAGR